VLKLMDDGPTPHVTLQQVVVGRRKEGELQIVNGVGSDDRLVVNGAGFLNDGDLVRIADAGDTGRAEASP
jgi:hypothetical protein